MFKEKTKTTNKKNIQVRLIWNFKNLNKKLIFFQIIRRTILSLILFNLRIIINFM
jgi:hypothetical protein